jgi:hypothetical protein
MRRALIVLVAAGLAALPAGCGGSHEKPLDEALGYLPKDTAFVVAIDTDTRGDQYKKLGRLVRRFPFGEQVVDSLKGEFERTSQVDFDRDVKPLLGNEFVVGSTSRGSFAEGSVGKSFLGAIKTKDGDKLKDLAKRTGATKQGGRDGATIYRDKQGTDFAIKGDTLVVAGSRSQLEDAVARRSGHKGLTRESFDGGVQGVPATALIRGFVDVGGLLRSRRRAAQALRVPWVAALRSFGFSARAENDGVAVDFNLRTDRSKLRPDQLPLATGQGAPPIVRRPGEISIGIQNPGQLVDFGLGAARAASPQFAAGRRQLEQALGIDLKRDLADQLSGAGSLNVTTGGGFSARADVRDPVAVKRTLRKLAAQLPAFVKSSGGGPVALTPVGGGLYSLSLPKQQPVVLGVIGRRLVAATDQARARRFATARAQASPGAKGSLVLAADARRVVERLVRRLAPDTGVGVGALTAPLGALTGSVSSDTGGLRGRLKLEIR